MKKLICKLLWHKERKIYDIFGYHIRTVCKRCNELLIYGVRVLYPVGVFEIGDIITCSKSGYKGVIIE